MFPDAGFYAYDRDGLPIRYEEWAKLQADWVYRRIARTTVTDAADPSRTFDVSTIWIGLNLGYGGGPPLIFETMVFAEGSEDEATDRYATETQARAGHTEMVTVVATDMVDPVIMDAES